MFGNTSNWELYNSDNPMVFSNKILGGSGICMQIELKIEQVELSDYKMKEVRAVIWRKDEWSEWSFWNPASALNLAKANGFVKI